MKCSECEKEIEPNDVWCRDNYESGCVFVTFICFECFFSTSVSECANPENNNEMDRMRLGSE